MAPVLQLPCDITGVIEMALRKILSLLLVVLCPMQLHAKETGSERIVVRDDGTIEVYDPDGETYERIKPETPQTETQKMFDRLGRRVEPNDQVAEGPSASH